MMSALGIRRVVRCLAQLAGNSRYKYNSYFVGCEYTKVYCVLCVGDRRLWNMELERKLMWYARA